MIGLSGCAAVLEAISSGEPVSVELAAHLASCPACAGLRGKIDTLRRVGPSSPVQASGKSRGEGSACHSPPPDLRRQVMARLDRDFFPALGQPSSPPARAETPAPNSLFPNAWDVLRSFSSWPSAWKTSLAVGVITVLLAGWVLHRPPVSRQPGTPPMPPGNFLLASAGDAAHPNHPFSNFLLDAPLVLGKESKIAILPDDTHLEITGPAALFAHARGLTLNQGKVEFAVTPGPAPFRVMTPHGKVEVLGTTFLVDVSPNGTRVEVRSGTVRVTPDGGAAKTVTAGGTAVMAPPSVPPLPDSGTTIKDPNAQPNH